METMYVFYPKKIPMFGNATYGIEFEGNEILEITASKEFVFRIVQLLNGAWNLGYGSGLAIAMLGSEINE